MTDSGPNELRRLLAEFLNEITQENREEMLELSARLSAQRYLLEQLYANSFLDDPDGFDDFMADAIERGRTKATRSEPMPDEMAVELQARIATHFQRFQESVSRRLRGG